MYFTQQEFFKQYFLAVCSSTWLLLTNDRFLYLDQQQWTLFGCQSNSSVKWKKQTSVGIVGPHFLWETHPLSECDDLFSSSITFLIIFFSKKWPIDLLMSHFQTKIWDYMFSHMRFFLSYLTIFGLKQMIFNRVKRFCSF